MNWKHAAALLAVSAIALSLSACGPGEPQAGESPEGPHGGRLLEEDGFALEVTIFERGVPPEFRIYPYQDGEPVAPEDVDLTIELERLGGRVDRFDFAPRGDYLLGDGVVEEPHSFEVAVAGEYNGKTYRWAYSSYEGRTSIDAEVAEQAGITIAEAGPGVIRETVKLYGEVVPDATRVRRIMARFPGVVRGVDKAVGDPVAKGERLATVEANDSLRPYAITAPIAGVVTERRVEPGEVVDAEDALLTVADYATVWVDLKVFPRHAARIKPGQPVGLKTENHEATAPIVYRSPAARDGGQATVARVVLPNPEGRWMPGRFVEGRVTVAEREVPVAVENRALQTFRDWDVVFIRVGDTYQVRPLELGAGDEERTEVRSGLRPGERYVVDNSYLIKADIEKSGATHDH